MPHGEGHLNTLPGSLSPAFSAPDYSNAFDKAEASATDLVVGPAQAAVTRKAELEEVFRLAVAVVSYVPREDYKYHVGVKLPESQWKPGWDFHAVVESGIFEDRFRELFEQLKRLAERDV